MKMNDIRLVDIDSFLKDFFYFFTSFYILTIERDLIAQSNSSDCNSLIGFLRNHPGIRTWIKVF